MTYASTIKGVIKNPEKKQFIFSSKNSAIFLTRQVKFSYSASF